MNEVKYKKGDYVKVYDYNGCKVYIVKLLEDSYSDGINVRAIADAISYNGIKYSGRNILFILENSTWTSKKLPYMNTALYKILNKA